jgi:hypothetical protein
VADHHSLNRQQFAQRLRRFTEWAASPKTDLPDAVRQKILGLKAKAPAFKVAFDLPNAARTSNAVDRLMNDQDRHPGCHAVFPWKPCVCEPSGESHGTVVEFPSLLHESSISPPYSKSPFQDLNGFRYHEHWLRNLMIAASLNGRGNAKPSPHKLN